MKAIGKITSERLTVKNVNVNIESRIFHLEKLQAKTEQYNRRKNVKISESLSEILDEDHKSNVIEICIIITL